MSSLRVTTVLLPPAKGRSIDGDSRRIKTGENSRPTIGENSTAAHSISWGVTRGVTMRVLLSLSGREHYRSLSHRRLGTSRYR